MTEERANKIYDLLVTIGGASESQRDTFIYDHTEKITETDEWRFGGYLGFGGKYRADRNLVQCYREDETPEIIEIKKILNTELNKI